MTNNVHIITNGGSIATRASLALRTALAAELELDTGDVAKRAYAADERLAARVAQHQDAVEELLAQLGADVAAKIAATARQRDEIHEQANAIERDRWRYAHVERAEMDAGLAPAPSPSSDGWVQRRSAKDDRGGFVRPVAA